MATAPADLLTYLETSALDGPELWSAREREVLAEVNARVAARETTEAVIDFLFERTADVCPGDRLSIALVDEPRLRLSSYYTRATYAPLRLDRGYAEDLAQSSLGAVIHQGRPRIIHDLTRYLAAHPASASTRALVNEGVRSNLTVPLTVEGRVIGALFRSARTPDAYTAAHARFHAAIAERVSQAIEKTYRLEQLAAANLAYTEMLGFVSHELKSPVAAMVSTAEVIADGYLGPVEVRQQEALARIASKGRYLLDLVRDYLELARIEGGTLQLDAHPVDFARDVLAIALDVIRGDAERRQMHVDLDVTLSGPVTVDASLMKVVLVNLLSNAVKYGRDGGRLRVTAREVRGTLEIAVYNEGPGFPPEQHSRLFRRFSRLTTPELRQIKGSGVGLYSVWRIVQLHAGRIAARSEPGAWAEFTVTIPQPQRAF